MQGWGGSITALAALHLTNGLLLSARDRPGDLALTLAGCDTGPGVSRKHDTASTGRGGQETATEQPWPRPASFDTTRAHRFANLLHARSKEINVTADRTEKSAEMGSTCRDKGMRWADLPC